MRVCLISLCVILCAVYTQSESRQYYPGVGYVSTGDRPVKSSRLRAAPAAARNSQQRSRPARLREDYELLEREELAPARRQTRRNNRNSNRRSSARRSSPGRRYRLARNEATTVDPPPASEPVAPLPAQPAQAASQPSLSADSSPVRAFGGIFPNFQAGGLGGVTGGGFAQTNGPGAAFAAGFAQSSGSQSFAGGFGAVINHPKFPKFGGSGRPINKNDKDSDLDNVSSKDDARSDDSGFDDPIDDSESDDDQKLDRLRRYRG
ncbi:uncharacterized protein LOC107372266 isoform X2 [Tetranychus urticae]|uniref:uncharacterized protein LOC107372266 isoform X2 n=1 Tax=Tetranychus urticae TaxID=32264 RepID=UPI00077BB6DB|nr:uncharacterized protein LOC107372266 isoform X2 [Tetranychus urticae]